MGLDSYRFTIEFEQPVLEEALITLLGSADMMHLSSTHPTQSNRAWRELFFEMRTDKGLIETHCLLAPEDTTLASFNLRFSIVSPSTVIGQTFSFLVKLHALRPIRVYDTEISHHIYRRLRQEGRVDIEFKGLGSAEKATINSMCYIPINRELFEQNPLGILKRQIVLNNSQGAIVEGGDKTFDYLKKGTMNQKMG